MQYILKSLLFAFKTSNKLSKHHSSRAECYMLQMLFIQNGHKKSHDIRTMQQKKRERD